ncbi:hypothetical protein F5Y02DRAFT_424913 [Annulohypoxylon stygium]|nr:hypothetical protein F5Y02DRAFT_424913 [Annulohypoxylon stygium]
MQNSDTAILQYGSSNGDTIFTGPIDRREVPSFTALNYVSALIRAPIQFYSPHDLKLLSRSVRSAGTGGFSTIEIGGHKRKGFQVAVKRSRLLPKIGTLFASKAPEFRSHFEQFVIELCILTHERVTSHPNIIKLLGICSSEDDHLSSLALVFEYSSHGTLRSFLIGEESRGLKVETLDLILQVARGLECLHQIKVVHCDVKTENVLMFYQNGKWIAKISDFGQSLFTQQHTPDAKVVIRHGTPLLGAPEIRRNQNFEDISFSIKEAICTDVFSFGLLIWEALKGGRSYFDEAWLGPPSRHIEIYEKEDFLNQLSMEQLLEYADSFFKTLDFDKDVLAHLYQTLEGCLHYQQVHRKTMSDAIRILCPQSNSRNPDTLHLPPDAKNDMVTTWSSWESLYEAFDTGISALYNLDGLPLYIQEQVLSELMSIAKSETVSLNVRANAAMTIAECYTIGFGSGYNSLETAKWIREASSLGLRKATMWYPRICCSLGLPLEESYMVPKLNALEQEHSLNPTKAYLPYRIFQLNGVMATSVQEKLLSAPEPGSGTQTPAYPISLFNDNMVDYITAPLLSAWLGETETLSKIIDTDQSHAVSSLGFDIAHYCCMSGRVDVLEIVVKRGLKVVERTVHGITPLHLVVFSSSPKLTVDLLMECGASADAETQDIKWTMHGITLSRTPLEWATACRNRSLVCSLIPHTCSTAIERSLTLAISVFYWEIVEVLFASVSKYHFELPWSSNIRPISGWIAHGRDLSLAIEKTVDICQRNDVDPSQDIILLTNSALTCTDLVLVEVLLTKSNPVQLKRFEYPEYPLLCTAIERVKGNTAWMTVLEKLLSLYTTEELDVTELGTTNFLTYAVSCGSIPAVQALLTRGVGINTMPKSLISDGTAIHAWCHAEASPEMFRLLIEHKADLLARHPKTGLPVLIEMVIRPAFLDALKFLLTTSWVDEYYPYLLHFACEKMITFRDDQTHLATNMPILKSILSYKGVAKHLDYPDDNGATVLHKAAFWLHLDSVQLLLEAVVI